MEKVLFHYQTNISFGAGALGFKITKKGNALYAYCGIPQRGLKKIAFAKTNENLEKEISNLDDNHKENVHYIEMCLMNTWTFL